jgi:HlyD family secretion protein
MKTITMLIALATGALFSQNAEFGHVWSDEVRRGPMIREVRGQGIIASRTTVELTIPESHIAEVRRGQMVDVDSRTEGIRKGRVMRVDAGAVNGASRVFVRLTRATSLVPGTSTDCTIRLERLNDVIYVGRPVSGNPNSIGMLFKIDADGAHATKVRVQFGRSSVNTIQVLAGLQVGDHVILSDMTPYEQHDRIALK